MRSPMQTTRRRSAAAKCCHLVRELHAPFGPVLLFLSFRLDDVGGRALGESLVLKTLGKRTELGLELLELCAELAALLCQVDKSAEGYDDFTTVGEHRMRSTRLRRFAPNLYGG